LPRGKASATATEEKPAGDAGEKPAIASEPPKSDLATEPAPAEIIAERAPVAATPAAQEAVTEKTGDDQQPVAIAEILDPDSGNV
jgi:nucleoid-associated protein YgaU